MPSHAKCRPLNMYFSYLISWLAGSPCRPKEMHQYLLSWEDDSGNYTDTSHPADIVPHELSGNPSVVSVNLMALENWYRQYGEKRQSSVMFKPSEDFVGASPISAKSRSIVCRCTIYFPKRYIPLAQSPEQPSKSSRLQELFPVGTGIHY